jgi:ribosomal RNA-processing protein 7
MAPSSSTSSLLIKGFLPVRLKIPGCNHYFGKTNSGGYDDKKDDDETFFFVKPHVVTGDNATSAASSKALFVVNVPMIPGIRTKILLKALLGRFGDVEQITVVDNPRNNSTKKLQHPGTTTTFSNSYCPVVEPSAWSKPLLYPTFLPAIYSEGKFAHVEFTSAKEMKRAMKVLNEMMSEEAPQDDANEMDVGSNSINFPAIRLEKLEVQTLMDETQRQHRNERQDPQEEEDWEDAPKSPLPGILAVAERYRAVYRHVLSSRSAMLDECNAVMESFELAEESNQKARETAAHAPDDDGFVTVSYSNTVSTQQELELAKSSVATGRKSNKRSRKKKESAGASQLPDFYRFQRKENKKRDLQELRKKFEEDLAKVKRMKEEQQYRPFG